MPTMLAALGEREVLRFLAEVGLGGSVDAVAALAEVDNVEDTTP